MISTKQHPSIIPPFQPFLTIHLSLTVDIIHMLTTVAGVIGHVAVQIAHIFSTNAAAATRLVDADGRGRFDGVLVFGAFHDAD